jgi:hypothetical protein
MTDMATDLRTQLEGEFNEAMERIYHDPIPLGYRAGRYIVGLRHAESGLAYAHHLLAAKPRKGLSRLQRMGRPDLSVEFLVLNPKYTFLFTDDERQVAWERLRLPVEAGSFSLG